MSLTFHSPVIFVKDIKVSKDFYTRLLEQETEHDFGANILFKSHLSLWQVGKDHEIAEVVGNNIKGNTHELYFETEDIEGVLKRIKESNVRFLHTKKTEPWGQMTFRFFDPDGHLIEIGESLNTFVSRIFHETGSVSATMSRTGVPEETIRKILDQQ
jgi:catechol 2,3-dioxygenase-like lactoylglutathione lyase family enzyme